MERLGIALEPEAEYELRPGGGGCEDPRVTFVEPLKRYIMTYTAFSPLGPRIAIAESEDLFHWKRLGLATYAHWHGIELADIDDKDASLFPVAIPDSTGKLELGMLHRPLFAGTRPKETAEPWKASGGSRPGEHLDFILPGSLEEPCPGSPCAVYFSSQVGNSSVAVGATQDWRRYATHSH